MRGELVHDPRKLGCRGVITLTRSPLSFSAFTLRASFFKFSNATKQCSISAAASNAVSPSTPGIAVLAQPLDQAQAHGLTQLLRDLNVV